MRDLSHIQKVVVKVGSSSLTDENGRINDEKMLALVSQLAYIKRKGMQVILVSSGAQAAGMGTLGLRKKPSRIAEKQALAAVGQAKLMQHYEDLFRIFDLKCAQILVNHDDFDDRKRLSNFENAMQALLDYDVIPIINENDTLAVEEIKVGDNDTLAALIVPVVDGDILILMSDIDGLYDGNPKNDPGAKLIPYVGDVREVEMFASDTAGGVGTGGMITKLSAAKIVNAYGCDMAIINSGEENSLRRFMDGEDIGTFFDGHGHRDMSVKKHWIMYRSNAKGRIIVDGGAFSAIRDHHKSLLPKGIVSVTGSFMSGSVVEIAGENGELCGKGVTNYSSDEIRLIMGHPTSQIGEILQGKTCEEVVHADMLVAVR